MTAESVFNQLFPLGLYQSTAKGRQNISKSTKMGQSFGKT